MAESSNSSSSSSIAPTYPRYAPPPRYREPIESKYDEDDDSKDYISDGKRPVLRAVSIFGGGGDDAPLNQGIEDTHTAVSEDYKSYGSDEGEDGKRTMDAIAQLILDLNGAQTDMVAGQARTYINPAEYVQYVVVGEGKEGLAPAKADVLQQALNYKALGGGKMGCLAAQLRRELWHYFSRDREAQAVIHNGKTFTAAELVLLKEYADNLSKYNTACAVVRKNAKSFAAQAAINVYSKIHHWDSKKQGEWHALIAAIGLTDVLAGEDIRPLVYTALHPIPLSAGIYLRKAAMGEDQKYEVIRNLLGDAKSENKISSKGFVNSVSIRAHAIPAGQATLAVCANGWMILSSEEYAHRLKKYIKGIGAMPYREFMGIYHDIKRDGESYHPMAREFGKNLKVVNQDMIKIHLTIAAAYILEVTKGTLAKSAALNKFAEHNRRAVDIWRTRFKIEKASEQDSITAFLTSVEHGLPTPAARVAAIKAEGIVHTAVADYARDQVKMAENVKELGESTGITLESLFPPSERAFLRRRDPDRT